MTAPSLTPPHHCLWPYHTGIALCGKSHTHLVHHNVQLLTAWFLPSSQSHLPPQCPSSLLTPCHACCCYCCPGPLSPPPQSAPPAMASKTPPNAPPVATALTTQGAPRAAPTAPQPPSMPQWTEQESPGPPLARPSSKVPSASSSASPSRANSPQMPARSTSMLLCCLSLPTTSLQQILGVASGHVRPTGHVWCSMMSHQGCVTMERCFGTLLAPTAPQAPSLCTSCHPVPLALPQA